MNWTDHAVTFRCNGEVLVGVLSLPDAPATTAVIIIVGGPQYRVGSHRQFVLLARRLADAGYAVLRFDHRGIGDSSGAQRSFEDIGEDIGAAIDTLQQRVPDVARVVLWGLCDAASAALLYCGDTRDPRVQGLCLLNPWVRNETSLARTHVRHYYAQRLVQPDFWARLVTGKIGLGAITGLAQSVRQAARDKPEPTAPRVFHERMAAAWRRFRKPLLLVLSGQDYTAKEFLEHVRASADWKAALANSRTTRHDLPDADHTFSNAQARGAVERLTLRWLQEEAVS